VISMRATLTTLTAGGGGGAAACFCSDLSQAERSAAARNTTAYVRGHLARLLCAVRMMTPLRLSAFFLPSGRVGIPAESLRITPDLGSGRRIDCRSVCEFAAPLETAVECDATASCPCRKRQIRLDRWRPTMTWRQSPGKLLSTMMFGYPRHRPRLPSTGRAKSAII
jgi:hypothetical protein